MFATRNLSSVEVKPVVPWEWSPPAPAPDNVRTDKKARDGWINRPKTDWCCYTGFEAVNNTLRISKENPPLKLLALVADYDAKTQKDYFLAQVKAAEFPPNYVENTLSGNWRAVWLLEEPISMPSYDFATEFLRNFEDFGFTPSKLAAGFDKPAWMEPNRLYTWSGDWIQIRDEKLSDDLTRGWLGKASQKFNWSKIEDGVKVPFALLAEELKKKYPKFSEWPGDFELNSQGPTFWVDQSTSPKSAIVRETGIQTFSAHASKPFYHWADLLGAQFIKNWEAERLGSLVEGIYYDGKHYWRKSAQGVWSNSDRPDLSLYLTVQRGITQKVDKNGVSELSRVLSAIQENHRVTGAAPCVFRPEGLVKINGSFHLNTSDTKVMQPIAGIGIWGPEGNFPWVSHYLDGLFTTKEQLRYFLAWLARFYQSGLNYVPCSGQALCICGPANAGKTLLARKIIGDLVGGFAEAGPFLSGDKNAGRFNQDLFEKALWCQDDATLSADYASLRHATEFLKKAVANPTHRVENKYLKAALAFWSGRLILTFNSDAESMLQIPDLSQTILDKLMLFLTKSAAFKFPENHTVDEICAHDLPAFARWLADYRMPADLRGDSRFGVRSYHEPSLVRVAYHNSQSAEFDEILADYLTDYFLKTSPSATEWRGTALALQKSILCDETSQFAMRSFSVGKIGRMLSQMKTRRVGVDDQMVNGTRHWVFTREFLNQS